MQDVLHGCVGCLRPVNIAFTLLILILVLMCGAMSPFALTYMPILQFEPSYNVTSQPHAARQRAVLRAALETGRQADSATMCRLALCRAVVSANATHKHVPNQPPYIS
jgi:hypothetical protein